MLTYTVTSRGQEKLSPAEAMIQSITTHQTASVCQADHNQRIHGPMKTTTGKALQLHNMTAPSSNNEPTFWCLRNQPLLIAMEWDDTGSHWLASFSIHTDDDRKRLTTLMNICNSRWFIQCPLYTDIYSYMTIYMMTYSIHNTSIHGSGARNLHKLVSAAHKKFQFIGIHA